MISSNDRAGTFGASDTRYVVAKNRKSKSWCDWWEVKLGASENHFKGNKFTRAGNTYEHSILTKISPTIDFDRQINIDTNKMLLRVNYDGNNENTIYEVKTHKGNKKFEISDAYWQQAQVEMFAWNYACEHELLDDKGAEVKELNGLWIVSYALDPEEVCQAYTYSEEDVFAGRIPIDDTRMIFHPVKYDKGWIKRHYLPNLKELTKALRAEKIPR